MPTPNPVDKFLQAVFGSDYGTQAIFANLHPAVHVRDFRQLDPNRDCYWSIAAFPPEAVTNLGDDALHTRALVIDDVGTKGPSEGAVLLALGEPTTIVESSAGNFQWGYRLSKPVAIADWGGFFGGIEALIGSKLDAPSAQTLMRLPMGVNTKKGKGRFAVRLVKADVTRGIDPDTIQRAVGKSSGAKTSSGGGWAYDIAGLMALIPNNDVHYDDWFDHAERVMAAAIDKDTARPVFEAWSAKSSKHDPDEIELRWPSVNPTRTAGRELLAEAEAADPVAYKAWHVRESQTAFNDGAVAPEVPPGKGRVKFKRGEKKQILSLSENVKRAIVGLGITCAYDDFHHRVFITRGGRLTDHIALLLRDELTAVYGKEFSMPQVFDAITTLALQNRFNPVVDMLAEAEKAWDGVRRLDRLGPDYFHSEDTELARRCFRKMMIAAVRRARRPGCKFDQILVLESPEGWDKSTAWAVLAGEGNFSDASIIGKDARAVQEELADIWIHENAELSGLGKADIEHVKHFASRVNDRARAAYGRVLMDQPRQSIEVGTTNAEAYLMSTTGNRRFWGFKLLRPVDTTRLRADRLQLWGEAAQLETGGETLVLDETLWDEAGIEQEKRRVIDPWEDELANLDPQKMGEIGGFSTISSVAIHDYLGGHRGQQINSGSGRKISEIMKRLGWERCKLKDAIGNVIRGYRRPVPSVHLSSSVSKKLF